MTFVGATLAVMGSVNQRLPSVPTFFAQVASAFASKLAPAGSRWDGAQHALRAEGRSRRAGRGHERGLNFVAGVFVHVGMLLIFAVWAGRDAFGSISFPDPTVALYGLAAVAVFAAISFAIPWVRHQLRDRLRADPAPLARWADQHAAPPGEGRAPARRLRGGDVLVHRRPVLLDRGLRRIRPQLRPGRLDLPRGLGDRHRSRRRPAASARSRRPRSPGLVAAGMPNDVAVPSVFLFRLATFWIPVVPGWVALTYLERAEYL